MAPRKKSAQSSKKAASSKKKKTTASSPRALKKKPKPGSSRKGAKTQRKPPGKAAPSPKPPKKTKAQLAAAAKKRADAKLVKQMAETLPDSGPGRPKSFINDIHFEFECRAYFASRAGVTVKQKEFNHGSWEEVELKVDLSVTVLGLCQYLGIATRTFYRYMEGGHEFHAVAEWVHEKCELDLQDRLFRRESHSGAKFLLSAKYSYSEKKDLNISGGISDEEFLAALDDDEE